MFWTSLLVKSWKCFEDYNGSFCTENWVHHVSHPLSIFARNLWLISPISILQGHCQGGDLEDKEVHRSSSQVCPGSPSARGNFFSDDRWYSWIQVASLKHIPVNLQIRASPRECGNHNGQFQWSWKIRSKETLMLNSHLLLH